MLFRSCFPVRRQRTPLRSRESRNRRQTRDLDTVGRGVCWSRGLGQVYAPGGGFGFGGMGALVYVIIITRGVPERAEELAWVLATLYGTNQLAAS